MCIRDSLTDLEAPPSNVLGNPNARQQKQNNIVNTAVFILNPLAAKDIENKNDNINGDDN